MSAIVKKTTTDKVDSFSMKETDFLLRLMLRSQFEGTEIETAHLVMQKLNTMHREKLES
tara:strand:- start:119 stop:295 length:177 start_codon:yes stop_codon:yes gene_type:complete